MMTILRVLVFILVQGCVVCDELYPISVLSDITENQLEGFSDNSKDDVEPSQEKLNVYMPGDPDNIDIAWIKQNIVDRYDFEKKPDNDAWKTQPTFEGVLTDKDFIAAADRARKFFLRNNDWETTKKNPKFRTHDGCLALLYITAARYLLVTHILHVQSAGKLIPCQTTEDEKILIPVKPVSGVCYPAPPSGSATCTSDYDVSLAGEDAGFLIENFNNYFQNDDYGFGKPSDLVLDANVYAFSLAYAFPVKFTGLPVNFASEVGKSKETVNFKMQELASAYFKVFKYNPAFFNTMKTGALGAMTAPRSKNKLNEWLRAFSGLNANVKLRIEDFNNSPLELREAHNAEYQKRVKEMSQKGGYNAQLLGNLAMAEIYAAEAYHTRGALRHIVGGKQMSVNTQISPEDLWVSMIENWGESNKEYNHCKNDPLEKCVLEMSKYMSRMFNAMRLVLEYIPTTHRSGLVDFNEVSSGYPNPEVAFDKWLGYKKKGITKLPTEDRGKLKKFLRQLECDLAVQQLGLNMPLPAACMSKMNDEVNEYNVRLAGLLF